MTHPAPNPDLLQVPRWETEWREVAPSVYAYIQAGGPDRPSLGISNAGLVIGDEGVMVIDTLGAPFHTRDFISAIRRTTDKPFRHVINTHHHGDHVHGNQYFMPAEIVSHPFCRDQVLKAVPGPDFWPRREGWADGTERRTVLPATATFDSRMTIHYGQTLVELIAMGPAHTWGDIVVYLPQHQVLFAADIAFNFVTPLAHNGWITRWIEALNRILEMDVRTVVPGHGPLAGKKELGRLGEYFNVLKREARLRFDAGMSAGRAAADIDLGPYAGWVSAERLVVNTVRLYGEFHGTLTPAMDAAATDRATDEYKALTARQV